jgi:diacylglycerol kinase (ATP)
MKKLYFIINPKAGNGKALSIWAEVESELRNQSISYSHYFTKESGHARNITEELVLSTDKEIINLVVIGGDGTMNEVVNGIAGHTSKARIGFIPGGSGNDFSRGYGIPPKPLEALSYLLKQMDMIAKPFDLGKIQLAKNMEHFFINSTGAGFDAFISYHVNQSKWKGLLNRLSLGQLVYVLILLKYLFTYKCTKVELTMDGRKHVFPDTWFVTVSNQPFYGGGMKIAPDSLPNDGKLNVTIVARLSRIKLLLVFLSVFWGKHLMFKEVNTFLAQTVSIKSSEPIYVHSDGEHIGHTPLHISVHKEPIAILTKGAKY